MGNSLTVNLEEDCYDHRDKIHHFYITEYMFPRKHNLIDIGFDKNTEIPLANTIAYTLKYENEKDMLSEMNPSSLFIHANTEKQTIRSILKGIKKYGFCLESELPFDSYQIGVKPTQELYDTAISNNNIEYRRIKQNLNDIKHCLVMTTTPIVFGCSIFNDDLSLPERGNESIGKAPMIIVGYNDATRQFQVKHNLDIDVEFISYDYVLNPKLCFDLWTVKYQ